MMEPIEVNYRSDDGDWAVTVTGLGKTLTATAPGIIAARDRADQLVDKLTPGESRRTVVHRLDGSAVEFTTAYLNARLIAPETRAGKKPAAATSTPAGTRQAGGQAARKPARDATPPATGKTRAPD